ncbi:hypothetical protein RAA17_12565 [Komagataeibacter rhaeticus]|nr:hypothetical protein [Komagataeibacter rhaeticus]
MALEVEGHAPAPWHGAGGWFECVHPCGAGARYRYRVGPDLAVPDPASCYQPDDVHGPSEVMDPADYDWQYPAGPAARGMRWSYTKSMWA